MAEFCLECWNKLMDTNDSSKRFIISRDLDLGEECGEWKRVIVRVKLWYMAAERFGEFIEGLRRR